MGSEAIAEQAQAIWDTKFDGWECPDGILMGPFSKSVRREPELRQDKRDIIPLLKALLSQSDSLRKQALEIGLLDGGTHLIWLKVFERVASVQRFRTNVRIQVSLERRPF